MCILVRNKTKIEYVLPRVQRLNLTGSCQLKVFNQIALSLKTCWGISKISFVLVCYVKGVNETGAMCIV